MMVDSFADLDSSTPENPHDREDAEWNNYTLGRIYVGADEQPPTHELVLEMCENKCCFYLIVEDTCAVLASFSRDDEGVFQCDMKKLRDELANPEEVPHRKVIHFTEQEIGQIVEDVEDRLRFITSLPPMQIKPLGLSAEERSEVNKRFEEDPMLLEMLKQVCVAKTTSTASMLAKRFKICRRSVISKMQVLKELKLVESKERFKGYIATKEAYKLLRT